MKTEDKMTIDRELKRLGRTELLELLLASAREKESMESANEELKKQCEEAQGRAEDANELITSLREQFEHAQEKSAEAHEKEDVLLKQLQSARGQLADERMQRESLEKRVEELERELEKSREAQETLKRQLDDRVIEKEKAGTLADAAIQINGVLAAAQKAADQYLENIERMHTRQEQCCTVAEAEAKRRADELIYEAEKRCALLEEQTRQKCEALRSSTEKNVWQKWSSLSEQLQQISTEIRNSVNTPEND